MKRFLSIFALVLVAAVSCQKEKPTVTALFTLEATDCQILEEIPIKNLSTAHGTQIGLCKWEWEDQVSYETDLASISFKTVGDKTVSLTVWGEEGVADPNNYTLKISVYHNNEPPVVAFDMPGVGGTDEPAQPLTVEDYVDFAESFAQAVAQSFNKSDNLKAE